jgi:hypothetical protein
MAALCGFTAKKVAAIIVTQGTRVLQLRVRVNRWKALLVLVDGNATYASGRMISNGRFPVVESLAQSTDKSYPGSFSVAMGPVQQWLYS